MKRQLKRECWACGCTDDRACPGGCSWDRCRGRTADGKDLSVCTSCVRVLHALVGLSKRLKISKLERTAYELGALSMLKAIREAEWRRAKR